MNSLPGSSSLLFRETTVCDDLLSLVKLLFAHCGSSLHASHWRRSLLIKRILCGVIGPSSVHHILLWGRITRGLHRLLNELVFPSFAFLLHLFSFCMLFNQNRHKNLAMLLQGSDLSLHRRVLGCRVILGVVHLFLRIFRINAFNIGTTILSGTRKVRSMRLWNKLLILCEINALSHSCGIFTAQIQSFLHIFWLVTLNELINLFVLVVSGFHFVARIQIESTCGFMQIFQIALNRSRNIFNLRLEIKFASRWMSAKILRLEKPAWCFFRGVSAPHSIVTHWA